MFHPPLYAIEQFDGLVDITVNRRFDNNRHLHHFVKRDWTTAAICHIQSLDKLKIPIRDKLEIVILRTIQSHRHERTKVIGRINELTVCGFKCQIIEYGITGLKRRRQNFHQAAACIEILVKNTTHKKQCCVGRRIDEKESLIFESPKIFKALTQSFNLIPCK